jgi:dolichol kinase
MTELEVQAIENRIVSKKIKELTGVPRVIRRQLLQIKNNVIKIWGIDTICSAEIQLLLFRTVVNSCLTLNVLEVAIKKHGNKKVKFEKWLKNFVKHSEKCKNNELKKNGKTE